MRRIHVLTHKEEISSEGLTQCIVVIIDVLLATSTIAAVLHHGLRDVLPVSLDEEAWKTPQKLKDETYIFAGEKNGNRLENVLYPDPIALLKMDLTHKTLVLSTTNGTAAICRCSPAKQVYTSSLLNGSAVANHIQSCDVESSILIVCAGSEKRFSLEDFLGAGYLISELLKNNEFAWSLSDSAQAAWRLYQSQSKQIEPLLKASETGRLLVEMGYEESIRYASRIGCLPVVPMYHNHRMIDVQQKQLVSG